MRHVLAVTVGRSDFGIYSPVFRAIDACPELELSLLVTGMHMCPEFGLTRTQVDDSGFKIAAYEEIILSADSPGGISRSMGVGMQAFAAVYEREHPDLLMVLGDRFEMFAAVAAAVPFQMPIVHLHGGELTEGAIDDAFRHSITKMSHVHMVATQDYGRRVRQLGEESHRVHVVGAPGLDLLEEFVPMTRPEFSAEFGLDLPNEFLLATFHPVTTELDDVSRQVVAFLDGIASAGLPCVITSANADTFGRHINKIVKDRAEVDPCVIPVPNLGSKGYFSVMSMARAMVGNSSSGLIEAASFGLPVLNVGIRQQGRYRPRNVVDVECQDSSIRAGLHKVLAPEFKVSLKGMTNPYGDGQAAQRIVTILKELEPEKLIPKRFVDHEILPS